LLRLIFLPKGHPFFFIMKDGVGLGDTIIQGVVHLGEPVVGIVGVIVSEDSGSTIGSQFNSGDIQPGIGDFLVVKII
jgi:hypothetical protein